MGSLITEKMILEGQEKTESLRQQIKLEQAKSPNQVTAKEIELLSQYQGMDHKGLIVNMLNRSPSEEQIAAIMERFCPSGGEYGSLWPTIYAGLATEDEQLGQKIIKGAEIWGKKQADYCRYERVMDFYEDILDKKLMLERRKMYYSKIDSQVLLSPGTNNVSVLKSAADLSEYYYGIEKAGYSYNLLKDMGSRTSYLLDKSYRDITLSQNNVDVMEKLLKVSENVRSTALSKLIDVKEITSEENGALTVAVKNEHCNGRLTCDIYGKVLSYEELGDGSKSGAFTVFYKKDGKTVDYICEASGETIDINSKRGRDILINIEDMVEKKAYGIQKYVENEENMQQLRKCVQQRREIAETVEKNAVKLEEKLAEKGVDATEQNVAQATEKTATKSAMKATAAKAGAKVKTAAKSAGQTTKKTLLALNKAHDDAFDAIVKWGDKHAPQWMNKVEEATVQKAAEKFMKTKSGQAIAKQIEKKIGKEAAVSIAKKIPLICLGVGAMCVYDRLKEGEILKAVGEGTSALVANVPGLGTLASFGLDGAMLSDDLKIFEHGVMPRDPNSHVAAESTFVEKPVINQEKLVRKVDKAAEGKRKAEEKKKAQKFEANLYKYGGKSGNFYGG